jgi:hypothetical protein
MTARQAMWCFLMVSLGVQNTGGPMDTPPPDQKIASDMPSKDRVEGRGARVKGKKAAGGG